MPLTIAAINAAKPRHLAYKLADGQGLYLLISPSGGRLWRMNYGFLGHQKTLTFGSYTDVSLARARERRSDARRILAEGIDPLEARKARAHKLEHSMSRRGNCHDNAVAESFFNLLKRERIRRRTYKTREEARQDVFDYIEMFYNPIRKHVRNGMLSPVECERQQALMAQGV